MSEWAQLLITKCKVYTGSKLTVLAIASFSEASNVLPQIWTEDTFSLLS